MAKLTEKTFYVKDEQLFYDWKKIEKIPEFAVLKKCEQNPRWHSEGNVWNHTVKVCEAMVAKLRFYRYTYKKHPQEAKLLMTAALFHDIGKGVTTTFKKGNWHAYGHEVEGEKITRRLLWDEGFEFREQVCSLVRHHMDPLVIMDSPKNLLEKIVGLSQSVNIKNLCLLKHCDIEGSQQMAETSTHDIDIAKVSELQTIASHLGCLSKPSHVPLTGKYEWKKIGDTRKPIKVYVMVGLPGAGKDTCIADMILNDDSLMPMPPMVLDSFGKFMQTTTPDDSVILSRDNIREELGFCKPGEKIVGTRYQEDKVTKVFNDRLKEAADAGKDIIVDAINIKKEYRVRLVESLANYRCTFNYVYVEAEGLETNIKRRQGQIDKKVFEDMLGRFEFPTYDEYDDLYIFINNNSGWVALD